MAIETRGGCGREQGIALEFDEREIGLKAIHDGVQERLQDVICGRDPVAEVDAVRLLHPVMKPV